MEQEELASRLACATRFRRLIRLQSCDSTQSLAQQDGAADAAIYWADHQSAGRGRQGRSWHDEPGEDLAVTFCLPGLRVSQPTSLAAAMPVAVLETLEDAAGEATLKWPNDLLLRGRKIAGILIDTAGSRDLSCFIGVGINVNSTRFPPELRGSAASLALVTGHEHDRAELLLALAMNLERALDELERGQSARLATLFAERQRLRDKIVVLRGPDGERRGRLLDMDLASISLEGGVRFPLALVQDLKLA